VTARGFVGLCTKLGSRWTWRVTVRAGAGIVGVGVVRLGAGSVGVEGVGAGTVVAGVVLLIGALFDVT